MSVRNNLNKLLPFKIGEFSVTDNADFISTLCSNELAAFEAWLDLFERCGGLKSRNFEAFYLYGFFMDGKTPIEAIEMKPFDISEHNWNGVNFEGVDSDGDISLSQSYFVDSFYINKQDAIAIAKHFKLNEGDLK